MTRTLFRTFAALGGLAALAACSDSNAPGVASPVRLSFTSGTVSSGAALSVGALGDIALGTGTDSLVITSAVVVVRKIELASVDTTACNDDSDDDSDGVDTDGRDNDGDHGSACAEIEFGPRLVALPVGGTSVATLDLSLPQGSYRYFEAKIRPARARSDAEFLAAHPDLAGVSVKVEGRFNGVAFTYRGRVEAEIEKSFDPPLVLDSLGTNVAVRVDLARWFRTSSGALVNPATANAGGVNERLVARNIKRSFHAFEDHDRDGRDDHGDDDEDTDGHGGSSGPGA